MRLKIDGCAGCGFCYLIWREWFYHKAGYGEKAAVRDVEIPESEKEEVYKAVNQCPGRAISIIGED